MASQIHTRVFSRGVWRLLTGIVIFGLAFEGTATNHILRQDELMAGLNGDPNVQFIEITVSGGDQKVWGPPRSGQPSRAMLVFFNGAGVEVGRFFFPSDAPPGGNTVLIATTNFAALPGAPVPDFIIPALISPASGKVCFRGNPASPGAFSVNLCLSYGNFPADQTEGAGPPAPALSVTGDPISLTRFQNFSFGNTRNGDFRLTSPTPLNTRGQSMIFPVDGPEIELIPNALDFGSRNLDQGPTAPQTVIITNRGVVNPLIITNVALAGTDINDFRIVADSGQGTLPPRGGTRTVTLNFDPSTPGRKTASLRIICNDPNEVTTDLPLRGTGVDPNAPEIEVTPLSIAFGDHDVAAPPSAVRNVTIFNQGQIGSLNISNIFLSGPHADEFRITTPTNSSILTALGARVVSVTFDPAVAGPKSAVLNIVSDDTDEGTVDVGLQGRAFDLNPCTAPNPNNSVPQNLCANAQLVCPGLVIAGTLAGATRDGNSTCGPPQAADVWYRYVPGSDGVLVATATGSQAGLQAFSAHSGCPGLVANELACALQPIIIIQPGGTSSPNAQITIPVTNGVPVLLRLVGVAGVTIPFQLTLQGPDCVNFDQNQNGVTDMCESDFGDAPAPYPTTLGANGARHRAFTGVFLGERIDPDDDGQPTAVATGDNLDGDINDDDGVVLTSALTVGRSATLSARASATGFLNGWIDFNADGDWADLGEQVFANRALVPGVNALAFDVSADAVATNLTFARFRFGSLAGFGFTGAADDGEVEDYAVEILPALQTPGDLPVRISEVMAGLNGDSTVQFVELEANGDDNKAWGPHGNETVGRAMLIFFDGAGVQSGRFVFPGNAPSGADTVLLATRAFADLTGLQPDFIMPPEVVPIGGKVAFASNPDNRHFDIQVALSYGGTEYFGKTDGAGPANTNALPIMHAKSLTRAQDFPFGLNRNAAFQLVVAPSPSNTRGQTANLSAASIAQQGRTLFTRETFRGNGRTCATCHREGRDQFGLTPATIDELPHDDPLFVFEDNVNTLRLATPSRPSDLRGLITGASGTAWVLSGSGDTYHVIGGAKLAGAIADANGNSGTFQSFTEGDLDGPTPSNGSARGLEDHTLLEHGRGLILENIDGFKAKEVFRASPHLLTLALTAPFGLSGEFDSLDDFSDGAVVQHFPKSLARISGVDFRHPTREELAAMSEFMFGISNPSTNALNLDRLATTEAQKRGRAFFFGDEGRCSKCHSGPVLALSDGSLSGSVSNKNENFNTGVANLLKNLPLGDNLPTEPAELPPGQSTREFNTPGLFGIRLTAPFFHDGSAATLTEAVEFYDKTEFHDSPAGVDVGSLLAANKREMIGDLVAFLESLVELPVDFTREVPFGIRCPGQSLPSPTIAGITNLSATTISITNVVLNGPHTNDFQILDDSGQTNLAPGQRRLFEIAFSPQSLGVKRATLEIGAVDTNLLGGFSFGIALTGADVDNIVQATPLAFDFGMRDIDAPPSPEESIVITNDGSIALEVTIELAGGNPADFTMVTETNAIPPHGTRVIQVGFAPRTQGTKSAAVRIRMVSCSGTLIEIPLAGVATSTVNRFAWNSIGATQFVGTPFAVRVTAQDRNGQTVQNFRGTVRLFSVVGTQTNVVAPANSDPFVNGVWNGSVTVQEAAASLRLLARDNQGHTGLSDAFRAPLRDDLSLTVADAPDPIADGQLLTYTLTVHNTGPAEATDVIITDHLPRGVTLISGNATQGTVSHANGVVTASLGNMARAVNATVTLLVEAIPPAATAMLTNVATVTRNEPELNFANNTVTNTTRVNPFGVLAVSPLANFNSSGFSGGPFAPTNQIYTLSNSGTATLNWQARSSGCAAPPGLVAWWPLDGNAIDSIGTNSGTLSGGPLFTDGFIGQALAFDALDDAVQIPPSPTLNVGTGAGMTVEAWINPANISAERPIVEWNGGAHLWISVASGANGGPGSVFANVAGVGPVSHHVFSAPNLVVTNAWQHVALTYNTNTGLATLYLNGTVVARTNIGSFTPLTSTALLIGRRLPAPSFTGLIDEVGIYNRDLSDAEVQSIFAAGTQGKCGTLAPSCIPGAVSWWPAEGDTNDLVGSNHGVLVNGATFGPGLVGERAFRFDGVDDKVELGDPENLKFTNAFTVEAWLFADGPLKSPDGLGQIFFRGDTRGCLDPYAFWMQLDGRLVLHVEDGSPICGVKLVALTPLPTNQWKHVAGVFDAGLMRIFIDGALVAETNTTVRPFRDLDSSGSVAIGNHSGPFNSQGFNGLIDELTVYGRALSAAEIRSIFVAGAAGKCRSGAPGGLGCAPPQGLAGWWSFDGNLDDRGRTNFGVFTGNPVFTNGMVGQALFFNGGTDGVKISGTNALNLGTNDAFTVEAWVNVPNAARRNPVFEWDDGSNFAGPFLFLSAITPGSLLSEITAVGNVSHLINTEANLFGPNEWHHVGLSYNRLTGIARLYLNGAVVRESNLGSFIPRTTGNLFIGRRAAVGFEESFQGLIDELSVYARELTESEMRSIFAAGSSGKCRDHSWLTVSALAGTLAPGAHTNVTFSLSTNAVRLPVGSFTETVLFTNTANRRGTSERLALLAILNRAPTLGALAPRQIVEDSGPQTINLTGISAGGSEIQQLTVTASSSNPSLIPDPISVNYFSPATNGTLTFIPVHNAHGTSVVSVIVRDNGSMDHGAIDAVTNSFLVTVTPVNDAPFFTASGDVLIAEGSLLRMPFVAEDVDLPDDQLTYGLLNTPPAGMAIDRASGVLTWAPDEAQGPASHPVAVTVEDAGVPSLRATNLFTITVMEVNLRPHMLPIADQTVHEGMAVVFNALATDLDFPANVLTYTLGTDAPAGASITPGGAFTWTAGAVPVPSINSVSVTVTDNGEPALTDTKAFDIFVVSRPIIQSITRSGDSVTLRWTAIPGARYRVQAKPRLGDPSIDWRDLPEDITATSDSASRTDTIGPNPQRFYQVLVLPD